MPGPLDGVCPHCKGTGSLWSRDVGTWEPCGCGEWDPDEDQDPDRDEDDELGDDDGQPTEMEEWHDFDPDC